MQRRDLFDLVLLAALWGGSFLFMRIAVPEFGAMPLIELRVGLAALVLLPVLALRRGLGGLRRHAGRLAVVGVVNSALPFTLLAWAMLSMSAGFGAIMNSTAPLFGALIAYFWLGDRLTRNRVLGLLIGFCGVVVLAWDKVSFQAGGDGLALLAAMAATLCYGIGANFTKRYLGDVPALTTATGSQLVAAVVMLPLAVWSWPAQMPGAAAWGSAVALAVACTGLALIIFFRLIVRIGPAKAISVTFLIPAFGMLWGGLFLGEQVTPRMLTGTVIILLGTSLVVGLLGARRQAAPAGRPLKAPEEAR